MKKNKDTLETRQGCLLLLSPFIIVLVGMLVFLGGYKYINIINHKAEYKNGVFILEYLDCEQNLHGSNTGACTAHGVIDGIQTTIEMGTYYENVYNENPKGKKFFVFYRPDGKFTIRRKENETRFNVTLYIFKFLGFTVVPILGLVILSYYYYTLRKRVKQINKNEKTNEEI